MRNKGFLAFLIVFLSLFLNGEYRSGVEEVFVAKIMKLGDEAIIVRNNGEAYLIEKGIGCISLWRYEGKKVLIHSPGLFLGIGSKLIIPELDQECRIWNSEYLGVWESATQIKGHLSSLKINPDDATAIEIVQSSLKILGFYSDTIDGILEEKTISAIKSFQEGKNITPSGKLDTQTYMALSTALYEKFPNDLIALKNAISLLELAKSKSSNSIKLPSIINQDSHWISSISDDGRVIILEDGSIWEVASIDRIYTRLWLRFENVIIYGNIMINVDNGEKVSVTRIR